jgi:hypothetical protein
VLEENKTLLSAITFWVYFEITMTAQNILLVFCKTEAVQFGKTALLDYWIIVADINLQVNFMFIRCLILSAKASNSQW